MDPLIGPIIGVIGGSAPTKKKAATAEVVGHALAQAGAVLVCGGRGGPVVGICTA